MKNNHGSYRRILSLSVFSFLVILGCKPAQVENGKEVKMNYTLTVEGNILDTSEGKEPLRFVSGSGQIIPGLDEQLVGLKAGEKKSVVVPPEKGYGLVNPNAQQKVPVSVFGNKKDLKVGMIVNGRSNNGQPVQAKVLKIGPKEILLDFNHPLAGKTLNFDVEIVSIAKAPKTPDTLPAPNAPN
jgi:FKBP-type peptidyl-prolyl cis-trans isomerase SlyD